MMSMRKAFIFMVCMGLISGCASTGHVKYVLVKDEAPREVREEFKNKLLSKFELVGSAVFGYKFIRMSALGAVSLDEAKKRFDIIGYNPAGLKITDVHFRDGKVTGDFMFKQLVRGVNVPEVIAKDFKRIYFSRVPSPGAKERKEKYKIIFSEDYEDGVLDYVFAGEENNLVEKRFYRNRKLIWQVEFSDYKTYNNKIYPSQVILRNHQYQYKIVAKVKELK